MTDRFLKQPASDVVDDPNFRRLLRAFETGIEPGLTREFVEARFHANDGTVGDVLQELIGGYPRSLEENLASIRRAGAVEQAQIDQLKAKLEELTPPLAAWHAFMDGSTTREA